MRVVRLFFFSLAVLGWLSLSAPLRAADPLPRFDFFPNGQRQIVWPMYPAMDGYRILSITNLNYGLTNDSSGLTALGTNGFFSWQGSNAAKQGFFYLEKTPLSSNALLTASVLNRLAYGPTPDEIERVTTNGPQSFINEQLAPESLTETLDAFVSETVNGSNQWVYVTATGVVSASSSNLFIYLNAAGETYLDDLKLVAGAVPEAGANLIVNGDFESPLTAPWQVSTNCAGTAISSTVTHSGAGGLRLVMLAAGSGSTNFAFYQLNIPTLVTGQTYTVSYWYLPSAQQANLTVKFSTTAWINSTPDTTTDGLYRKLGLGAASLQDLRAWFCVHAVGAKRQLLEVLTQFLENHFVTMHSKSADYLSQYYSDYYEQQRRATELEFREIGKWRSALLNPATTFYDLLRISAESPAMIIYLDTVNSKGNGSNIANENYARELMELFTYGVDNGYDQADITVMSRVWTGWSVQIVDAAKVNDPFAARATNLVAGATNNSVIEDLVGVWAFNYKSSSHYTNSKTLFPAKTVPARFGTPWAGRNYQLALPSRTGTNGMLDGYDVLTHLANQPFTEEYISVKLCRLFVHDQFVHGVYDYSNLATLSPEGKLVRDCMLAWENSSPKGNMRAVLSVIFDSDLFRSHGGSLQKVKTPLEFTVSTIRALRGARPTGGFTASTDGYALETPMARMGSMNLFNRAEPNGYPETAAAWISAGTLAERVRFVQSVLIASGQTGKSDAGANNLTDPVGLLKIKLPTASWTNDVAVTDYFLGILYPAEGKANLSLYRSAATNFLNTADNGTNSSLFKSLTVSTTANSPYDNRVRGMVGMLMTLQRFQEQ